MASLRRIKDAPLTEITFEITQLVKHNNAKLGYWVACGNFIYDISTIIQNHPELIQFSGNFIPAGYLQANPSLRAKLDKHVIGTFFRNQDDELKKALFEQLIECTRIENRIHAALDDVNSDPLASCITHAQNHIAAVLYGIAFAIDDNEVINTALTTFATLAESTTAYLKKHPSEKYFKNVLLRYKGLCYLLKDLFSSIMLSNNSLAILEEGLELFRRKTRENILDVTNDHHYILHNHNVTFIGGSLSSVVTAMLLKQIGMDVHVYDKLDDPRVKYSEHSTASFNLVISDRGLLALEQLGLKEQVLAISFPLYGRNYHLTPDDVRDELYGPAGEKLNCVRREDLLCLLISAAEKMGVHLSYGVECQKILFRTGGGAVIDAVEKLSCRLLQINTNILIGADGVNSIVRQTIDNLTPDSKTSVIYQHEMTYREFTLPADKAGSYRLATDRLHIWPRNEFTFFAWPMPDKAFTLSFFIEKNHPVVANLQKDPQFVNQFVEDHFPELSSYIGRIILNETTHRWGLLHQVDAPTWYVGNTAVLIGDAAHAFYPFFGQAANSGLEDGLVLSQLIAAQLPEHYSNLDFDTIDWEKVFSEFAQRKQDTDTIANLANGHSKKLSSQTKSKEEFELQNKVALELIRQGVPSLHHNLSFTTTPYRHGPQISANHEDLLGEITTQLAAKANPATDQDITEVVAAAIASRHDATKVVAATSHHSQTLRQLTYSATNSSQVRQFSIWHKSSDDQTRQALGTTTLVDVKHTHQTGISYQSSAQKT